MDTEKLELEKTLLRKQIEREDAMMGIIREMPLIAAAFLGGGSPTPAQHAPISFARTLTATAPGPVTKAREQLDEQAKKDTEEILEAMKPDINENAPELLEGAIRETVTMLDGGTKEKIKKGIKQGRNPKVRRKNGCLYLIVGDGVSEPIEEVYLHI